MRTYENKDELKNEINKSFAKYISEFNDIPERLKDKRIDEVDRTPAENLAYENLILIKNSVHKLIHASKAETIYKYMDLLQLDNKQLIKVNHLRELASMQPI